MLKIIYKITNTHWKKRNGQLRFKKHQCNIIFFVNFAHFFLFCFTVQYINFMEQKKSLQKSANNGYFKGSQYLNWVQLEWARCYKLDIKMKNNSFDVLFLNLLLVKSLDGIKNNLGDFISLVWSLTWVAVVLMLYPMF